MTGVAALLAELEADPAALAELRRLLGGPAAYTAKKLADELGVTPRAIRAAIERGELAAARSGGRWVIGAEAVAAWATPPAARPAPRRRSTTPSTMRDALARLDTEA